ncbi:lysozyme [Dyadobacter sp. CY356]|uniref:lysozyme n=1 Tax=Dyadobacter sp. CY356 TaxID=2906442 RepID=UPI001F2EBC19|nr:lysozyme [Dyadobacter sp. CY356]MCF0055506.1 lysozyme [Dyadobacter sp. CY356]
MSVKGRVAGVAVAGALSFALPIVSYYEGLNLIAYLDPVGVPTICYGHTDGVKIGQTRSVAECDRLLNAELGQAISAVDRLVKVPMPDTRRAALGSFVYNAGIGAFAKSTLLKKLNSGDILGGCNEMLRWVWAGGKKLKGLERRRQAEVKLCIQS